MKIYTKTGDKGMTKLVGSSTVAKDSDRVESYGTIDELNSWVGYIISQLPQENQEIKEELEALQHLLFDAGTDLSTPIEAQRPFKLQKASVHWLEQRISTLHNHQILIVLFYLAEPQQPVWFMWLGRLHGAQNASLFV